VGAHADAVTCVSFSPDDKSVLTTSAESAAVPENAGAALWSVEKNKRLFAFRDPAVSVPRGNTGKNAKRVVASYRLAAFRADGDVVTVLNVNGEGFVSRWTPEVSKPDDVSWTIVGSIRATRDPVSAASASFDGARVGLGTSEGAVVLVDVGETGSKTKRPRVRACDNSAHMIFVTTLAFSTDGGYVLSGSADASARCAFARRQISAAAAFARVLFSFALLALSFLFLTLFLRRGGVAGFAAMKDTRGSIAPDADGGLDLMQGLDLADAAAQAREALREMAEDAGRVARDEEGAAPASADADAERRDLRRRRGGYRGCRGCRYVLAGGVSDRARPCRGCLREDDGGGRGGASRGAVRALARVDRVVRLFVSFDRLHWLESDSGVASRVGSVRLSSTPFGRFLFFSSPHAPLVSAKDERTLATRLAPFGSVSLYTRSSSRDAVTWRASPRPPARAR
jgi:hypothetical protein